MAVVEFRNVDIIFGRHTKDALAMVDAGATRDEILRKTGCVLGAAGVNLAVERGEICVLMGLSGSGKSTLLRAVNRLNEVARGEVLVSHDGKPVDVARCDERTLRDVRTRTVSMVFQQFGLLPWRTVRENAGFGLEIRGVSARERTRIVDEKLEMVGLSQWANKFVYELSGGMQQRVQLAKAIALEPALLLLDEPTTGLDVSVQALVLDTLKRLQRDRRITMVLVSHDLGVIRTMADRVMVMRHGEVVEQGLADQVFQDPQHPYTQQLVHAKL